MAGAPWPSASGPSSSRSWTTRLENVLEDRTALNEFRRWMESTHPNAGQPLDLHFAVRAFQGMCAEGNPKFAELAGIIYTKFLSTRQGTCTFIPLPARQEVGRKIKAMTAPDQRVFDPCLPFLEEFLRRQHEQFVGSDEFVEFFNRVSIEDSVEVPRHNTLPRPARSSHSSQRTSTGTVKLTLTADALLRSQADRENALGASQVERMFPPPVGSLRMPYVCHATTSQNDSAVSSSFSSDANGHQRPSHRLHVIKEEHLRGNPVTVTIPRVEQRLDGANIWDHSTEGGRQRFAAVLHEKLSREGERRRRNDATEQQLSDIANRKCTARDAVSNAVTMDVVDDDDDVDRYEERMRDDSTSQKASANRSPRGAAAGRQATTHSPKSPERSRATTATTGFSPFISATSPFIAGGGGGFAPPPALPPSFFSLPVKDKFYNRNSSLYTSGVESMYAEERGSPRFATPRQPARRQQRPQPMSQGAKLVTLSCKGIDGVPSVAHVPARELTLKDFRRHFAISSSSGLQFFFKTECEDGSAPYQLLLVTDDNAILPVFDGRITAECKAIAL